MPALLLRPATAALLAVALAPAAHAGWGARPHYDPYVAAGRAPVCTQAELSAGIDVADCGRGLLRAAAAAVRKSTRPEAN